MHFSFTGVLLLYNGYQRVRPLTWPFQDDFFENKNTITIKTCLYIYIYQYNFSNRIMIHHMYLHLTFQIIVTSDIFYNHPYFILFFKSEF